MAVQEKIIKSGRLMEAEFYPTFGSGRAIPTGAARASADAKKKYNRVQARRRLVRLVNANFDNCDNWCHLTYDPKNAPDSEEQAKKDICNFLRRVKRRRAAKLKKLESDLQSASALASAQMKSEYFQKEIKKINKKITLLRQELKYIYAIECVEYKSAALRGLKNWHFHLFMTGGLSENEIVELWNKGRCLRVSKFRPDKFGFDSAAKYMSKDPSGKKSFVCSRNLTKPRERVRPARFKDRNLDKIARQRVDDREYWENKYRGYSFVKCEAVFNEYNSRWYIRVIMYKTDGECVPDWRYCDEE